MSSATSSTIPNEIILYGYPGSPYFRRVKQYLAFRQISYAECPTSPILPRPMLAALGVRYRRIPVLSIGKDIYVDTSAILARLDSLFPPSSANPGLAPTGLSQILFRTNTGSEGVFARCAGMLDSRFPAMKDPAFVKDRRDMMGPRWGADTSGKGRAEAAIALRRVFAELETLLQDGRDWLEGGKGMGRADAEAVWPLDWALSDLQAGEYFSKAEFPKAIAWVERYRKVIKDAATKAGKPTKVKGEDAVAFVKSAEYSDKESAVDSSDPLGLKEGQEVQVSPTDSGTSYKDHGKLVKLTRDEVAIAVKTDDGSEVRIHAPRWNFKVRAVESATKL
ncbi:hypothetical protein B0A48_17980 [Cryoendolithus antarcticus]|uniref:Uncharacterized protein n=1 Tax=Cryoendolithus antarcticus TaxID=1507870 RepID=A0A1V8SA29_9PEZI|nr:hypothetical protein B0A48_17980 [Cryoendolithus antarcticus]